MGLKKANDWNYTKRFARESRPWIDSGQDHGWQDPFSIAAIGDLEWRVHGTEAILRKAGQAIDDAMAQPFDLLLGRKTYEIFASFFPDHADVWPGVNEVTKYVMSTNTPRIMAMA